MSQEVLNSYLAAFESALTLASSDEFLAAEKPTVDKLKSGAENIRGRRYVVSVIAAMKAGKSTTFNAFLGRDLLPNESEACTAAITEIHHSPSPGDVVVKEYTNGKKQEIRRSQGVSLEQAFHEDVRVSRRSANVSEIKKYTVQVPVLSLKTVSYSELMQRFVLVDTPGPNEAKVDEFDPAELQRLALEQLRIANALIVIFDYKVYKSDTNATLLKNIFDNREDLRGESKKLFFLVNKIDDRTAKDPPLEVILENVRKLIRESVPAFKNPRVYGYSARMACWGRAVLQGNADTPLKTDIRKAYGARYLRDDGSFPPLDEMARLMVEESGIQTIEKDIIETIFHAASQDIITAARDQLSVSLGNLDVKVSGELMRLGKSRQEVEALVGKQRGQLQAAREKAKKLIAIPEEKFARLRAEVQELIASFPDQVLSAVDAVLPAENSWKSTDSSALQQRSNLMMREVRSTVTMTINNLQDRIQRRLMDYQQVVGHEVQDGFLRLTRACEGVTSEMLMIDFSGRRLQEQANELGDVESGNIQGDGGEDSGESSSAKKETSFVGPEDALLVPMPIPITYPTQLIVWAGVKVLKWLFGSSEESTPRVRAPEEFTLQIHDMKKKLRENAQKLALEAQQSTAEGIQKITETATADIRLQIDEWLADAERQLQAVLDRYEASTTDLEGQKRRFEKLQSEIARLRRESPLGTQTTA